MQQWWHNAMTGVRGVTKQDENVVAFTTRQFLDVLSPSNFPLTNPGGAGPHARGVGNEPRARRAELRRGLGPRGERPAAGGCRAVRDRPQRCGDSGEGRLSQPADRADPVRAHHADGPARAGADRSGVDHEVLHSRPQPAELDGQVPDRARIHGLHDLVEESGAGGPRPVDGGLPDAGRDVRARRRVGDRAEAEGPRRRLLPGRHAARDRGGDDGARRRRALRVRRASSPRRPISPKPAS